MQGPRAGAGQVGSTWRLLLARELQDGRQVDKGSRGAVKGQDGGQEGLGHSGLPHLGGSPWWPPLPVGPLDCLPPPSHQCLNWDKKHSSVQPGGGRKVRPTTRPHCRLSWEGNCLEGFLGPQQEQGGPRAAEEGHPPLKSPIPANSRSHPDQPVLRMSHTGQKG